MSDIWHSAQEIPLFDDTVVFVDDLNNWHTGYTQRDNDGITDHDSGEIYTEENVLRWAYIKDLLALEKELIAEQEKWHTRINKLNDMWLDGKIETNEYNEQKTRLTAEYNRARAKQDAHTQSDWDVNNDIVHIFNSLTNIGDIFLKSSEDGKKRELLKTIFRTLIIKDGNVCYDLNFPFSECAKIAQSNNWRGEMDNFRTQYRQQIRELNVANWNWALPLAA